jgi:hypothetical protein
VLAAGIVGAASATATADPAPAANASSSVCLTPPQQLSVTSDVHLTADVDCGSEPVVFGATATVDLGGHTLRTRFIEALSFGSSDIEASFTSGQVVVTGAGENAEGSFHFQRAFVSGGLRMFDGAISLDHSIVDGSIGIEEVLHESVNATDSLVDGVISLDGGGLQLHRDLITGGVTDTDVERGILLDVHDNLIVGGLGVGLKLDFQDDVGGDVSDNLFVGGGLGIGGNLLELGPTTIQHNLVLGSKGSGISVTGEASSASLLAAGAGPVTLTGNLPVANQGHGIDAEWPAGVPNEVVDGGGNRAFLNRTSPQCIGVTCRGLF